jgi:hypothetical protein
MELLTINMYSSSILNGYDVVTSALSHAARLGKFLDIDFLEYIQHLQNE